MQIAAPELLDLSKEPAAVLVVWVANSGAHPWHR